VRKPLCITAAVFCIAALILAGCRSADHPQATGEMPITTDSAPAVPNEEIPETIPTGWDVVDGKICYLLEDGSMATGWTEIEGSFYYFRNDGSQVTGWLSLDGQRHYLNEDGAAVRGVQEIDGCLYVFDNRGMATSGWAIADGKYYYGDKNCHPLTGWQEIDGTRYLFGEDYAAYTGWLEQDGFRFYFTEDGSVAQGELEIDGTTHYFAFNGQEIILVNPWHEMPEDYTVNLKGIGFDHQVADIAYDAYKEMVSASWAAGVDPAVCSSYRTIEYQTKLFQNKVNYYLDEGYSQEEAESLAGTVVARPGTSEHHLGLALDIVHNGNWRLDESQANTRTQKWLMENSWRYGWILRYPDGSSESTGIIYEPWHYRYVGKEVAADIYASGLCLEDYLAMLTEKQSH